jgi:hypothetical protein
MQSVFFSGQNKPLFQILYEHACCIKLFWKFGHSPGRLYSLFIINFALRKIDAVSTLADRIYRAIIW